MCVYSALNVDVYKTMVLVYMRLITCDVTNFTPGSPISSSPTTMSLTFIPDM